ncbi:bifunctional phosphoribosyl-AMP cyclohydrolase/phosphoribosyl-ATP diphosphatase HisIE [Planctomycetota bacterium]|nr:bifunctional phosphoribosyl-AMP cyclohydrolase/phosphoribosyl-ATP diphosphatase HisIE [Planctomycetota bacterium]
MDGIKWNSDGLIPCVMQNAQNGDVLTLAWMNQEAFDKTLETGFVTFWSRSRKQLWTKGETSGNTMQLAELKLDCDGDALVARVIPNGPACHTGADDCFFQTVFKDKEVLSVAARPSFGEDFGTLLSDVRELLQERKTTLPEGSYSTYLFTKGIDKILKKIGEEATETVIAALGDDREDLKGELCDLLFHMLVLMVEKEISLEDLRRVMSARHKSDDKQGETELKVARPKGCIELEQELLACVDETTQRDIFRALEIMYRAHANQTREEGTPYATHPLSVALIVAKECDLTSRDAILAALLHDVLEDDMNTTPEEILAAFGQQVHDDVMAVTKQFMRDNSDEQEGLEHYYTGLRHASETARTVKLADRIHNLRSSDKAGWPRDKVTKYFDETRIKLIPLAADAETEALKQAVKLLTDMMPA